MKNMKKTILIALVWLLFITAVSGETVFDETSFVFRNTLNSALYPETAYGRNPSVLFNIKNPLMFTNLDFTATYSESVKTRIDDSIGLKDGTETISALNMMPDIDFAAFFPSESGSVFGFGVDYNSEHLDDTTALLNFNGIAEDNESVEKANTYTFGGDMYYARALGETMKLGFGAGYHLTYDPKLFREITDRTFNPSLVYYELTVDEDTVDVISHGIDGLVGVSIPLEKMDVSFGVVYGGLIEDRSNEYIAVDSDADGYKDELYLLEDYYLLRPEDGGPADDTTAFGHESYIITTDIDVTGSALDSRLRKGIADHGRTLQCLQLYIQSLFSACTDRCRFNR